MKRTGLLIFTFGSLLSLVTGFNYVSKEKVVEIGELEIKADKNNRAIWSPLVGLAITIVGGVIFVVEEKGKC